MLQDYSTVYGKSTSSHWTSQFKIIIATKTCLGQEFTVTLSCGAMRFTKIVEIQIQSKKKINQKVVER